MKNNLVKTKYVNFISYDILSKIFNNLPGYLISIGVVVFKEINMGVVMLVSFVRNLSIAKCTLRWFCKRFG